jgi:uncharacterized membrane protein YdjX (TVP38/TMEM64 family)
LTDRVSRPAGRGWRLVVLAALVLGGVLLARHLGAGDLLSGDGLSRVRRWVEGWGALGPLAFIAGYVLGVLTFVPGLAMTILAGVVFGPLWGTLYASIASTLGACLAFVIARYAARDLVARWVMTRPALARLDRATARHGFRLVMITRLVPIFPFNLQNYAYGVTGIGFAAYALTSWLCMLPATVALTIAGGALGAGGWDVWPLLPWLALAAAVLILLSLLPRWLRGKSQVLDDLVRPERGC